jgi:two-component system response regulator
MTKKFILLVEDNHNDELLTRRAFDKNDMGDQLRVTRDGVEALAFLLGAANQPPSADGLPALVLLDLKLPRLDGLEVLERLRTNERTRLLPVIIFTSSDEEQDRQKGMEWQVAGYVRKPLDFNAFVAMVRELGLCWLQTDGRVPSDKDMQA